MVCEKKRWKRSVKCDKPRMSGSSPEQWLVYERYVLAAHLSDSTFICSCPTQVLMCFLSWPCSCCFFLACKAAGLHRWQVLVLHLSMLLTLSNTLSTKWRLLEIIQPLTLILISSWIAEISSRNSRRSIWHTSRLNHSHPNSISAPFSNLWWQKRWQPRPKYSCEKHRKLLQTCKQWPPQRGSCRASSYLTSGQCFLVWKRSKERH